MRTLIVGGTKNFINNSLRGNLADLGLNITWHIDDSSRSTSIPEGCECVLVLKEMTGGGVVKTFKTEAKRLGIRHAEIPHKFSKARQTLLVSGIVSQDDLNKADNKRVSSPTEVVATPERKAEAAVQFILERLRKGIMRTSRDMLRAHMKTVFGPGHSISDKGVRKARALAATRFEEEQLKALSGIDSVVRDSIHMFIDDYPESANSGVYAFLTSLFEVDNIGAFLSSQGITQDQLDMMIESIRKELFTQWSKPFSERSEEEHAEIVKKRHEYIVRLCMWSLREKGELASWNKINGNCKKIFGSMSRVEDVKAAREEASEKFAALGEVSKKTPAPIPVTNDSLEPTPWFRRTRSNYSPDTVEAQLRNGISLYEGLSPGEVAVISSWMEKVLTSTGKPPRPDSRIRKVLQGNPPLTVVSVLYLCWGFLKEDLLAYYQYRDLYKVLSGKTLGSYIGSIVHRYVTLDGKIGEPIVPIYADEDPKVEESAEETAEEVEAQPETPVQLVEDEPTVVDEEELPPEYGDDPAPSPSAPTVDLSSLEAKLDALLSGQQATSAQMVAAQQAQSEKILAAIEDSQVKVRAAIEGVGQIIQAQNDILMSVSELLGGLVETSESTNNLTRGLVSSSEGISGRLESISGRVDELSTRETQTKFGFNQETQEIVSGLLAYLQQLNAPALVERLDSLEETIVSAAVSAGAASTGRELTLRDIIEMGGSVQLGGSSK